jgi:excisionase family DNA binding protein
MVAGHSFPASVRVYFPAPTGLDARSGDFLFGVSPPSPVLALMDGTHDLLRAIEPHKTAMTIEQVAELFGVSPETIRRMAALKQIGGAFKFGGS